jgi:ribonuclease HI
MAEAGILPANRNPNRPHACFLCNDGIDDLRHVFGDCAPVAQALHGAALKLGVTLPLGATMLEMTTLTAPAPQTLPVSPLFSLFMITFVWAVWSDRQRFFSAIPVPPSQATVSARLEEYTLTHLPRPRSKRTTPEAVIALANNPPSDAIVGFADGSAIPNPGPCGASALLFLPEGAGHAISAMSLGPGDNNLGEIAAMLRVLTLLDEAYERDLVDGHPPLLLFTDSLLVVGALEWGWATTNMPPKIRDLLKAYRARKVLNSVVLYWVKGHSDITHNETVDKEAKEGAIWSKAGRIHTRTRWTLEAASDTD